MADENPNPSNPALTREQPAAAAKKIQAAPPIITPTATVITHRSPAQFEEALKNFKPAGNGHPERIKAALAAAEILKAIFGDEADQLDANIETGGTDNGHYVRVQITRRNF